MSAASSTRLSAGWVGNRTLGQWLEISLTVTPEGAEAVADVLRRYVHQGISIERAFSGDIWPEDVTPLPNEMLLVRAYIPVDSQTESTRRQVEQGLYYLSRIDASIPEPTFTTVEDENWATAWKAHYQPVRIGQRIVIKPAWVDIEPVPDDVVIELDPGMAFGTGTHPTTQMCLQACEELTRSGFDVLDLGSGSGILGIAALKFGAATLYACDVDELAVQATGENAERNDVAGPHVSIHKGSLAEVIQTRQTFDLALANLTAKIIHSILPSDFASVLKPNGSFVFSGIIDVQADNVIAELKQQGLVLTEARYTGDWVMLHMQRPVAGA